MAGIRQRFNTLKCRILRAVICACLLALSCLWPSAVSSRPSRQVRHYFPGLLRVTQYLWTGNRTASGAWPYYGEAAGPPWMRFGTVVVVPGLGRFVILDRGGAVQ